jgi:hypothetical protein
MSISTKRCPTKPLEPVTTQFFGTSGNGAVANRESDLDGMVAISERFSYKQAH